MTDPELEELVEEARVAVNKVIWWTRCQTTDRTVARVSTDPVQLLAVGTKLVHCGDELLSRAAELRGGLGTAAALHLPHVRPPQPAPAVRPGGQPPTDAHHGGHEGSG